MERAPTLEKTQSRRTGNFRSKSRKRSTDPFAGDGDAKEETNHAQQVVRELYMRYKQQLERWRGYRDLACIMAFSTLYLAVLYTQRQAPIAHKVFQTLEEVLIPEGDSVASTADVYGWLRGVLKDVWKDPLCGDGLCEEPFEYPSYSRYGCRADCGKLNEMMNLTTIQINVEWNFTHPANALDSTTLREQASWNLCPVAPNNGGTEILFSRKCYFGDDYTFESPTGSTSTVLRDVPDGTWEMLIRRDTFHKTKGSVMDFSKVEAIAYYYRVYIAALAAAAQQNTEINLLEEGHHLATTPFMEYARMKIGSDAGFRDYVTATCACLGVTVEQGRDFNYSQPIPEDDDDTPLILRPFQITQADNVTTLDDLQTKVCQRYNYTDADRPVLGDGQAWEDLENDQFKTPYCQNLLLGSSISIAANSRSVRWAEEQVAEVKRLLVDEREGDEEDNGVADVGQAVYDDLKEFVEEKMGELYNPIFQTPRGVLVLRDLARAKGQAVYEQFYMGTMLEQGDAFMALTRASVESEVDGLTLPELAARAEARLKEVELQQDQFLNVSIPKDNLFSAETLPDSLKVTELIDAFAQALGLTMDSRQCQPDVGQPAYRAPCFEVQLPEGNTVVVSNTTLPEADAPVFRNTTFGSGNGTGTLYLPYVIVAWYGGGDAYLQDNLLRRAKQYIGECQALDVTCTRNLGSSKNPYNCTYLDTGEKVPGDMGDSGYREDCEIPCSEQTDCNALCECGRGGFQDTGCGEYEMCVCNECEEMNPDASKDSEFSQLITRSRGGASFGTIAEVNGDKRRQLGVQDEIDNMLGQTETLQELQDDIQEKIASVTEKVKNTNQLARQRVEASRLLDLVKAGKRDIESAQQRVDEMLNSILGQQDQTLKAAEDARKALGNIEEMANLQLQAQEALRRAVQDQVDTIQRNIDEGRITALEALVLYKRTRRDGRIENKRVNLANDPVVRRPTESYMFELKNDPFQKVDRARERYVGLTNRVISGLLLHQVRKEDVECGLCDEFGKIDDSCKGVVKTEPYGVDPVFKRGTSLYNPDFDDFDSEIVKAIYNCSALDNPTYYVQKKNSAYGQVIMTNEPPRCTQLFSHNDLPYAFQHIPLKTKRDGFPAFFDINLSEQEALDWATYLEEGLYIDDLTHEITAEVLTYNAPLRIVGYLLMGFQFTSGGTISVQHRMQTVRVELYNGYDDNVRFAFEIILSIWVYGAMLYTFYEVARAQKEQGNFLKYFVSYWNWLDFASIGLMTSCMTLWWHFVVNHVHPFTLSLRHNVYDDLQAEANFLKLANGGEGMLEMWNDFARVKEFVSEMNWYFALSGIAILLLIVRVLRRMDFQPNLGVVTRSLWLAGSDLIHFAIIFFMVFIIYALLAHLVFGHSIEKFSTFDSSVSTCFEVLLGNIGVVEQLRELPTLQAVAGGIFFWTYQLLVFFVMLNFLLAIIVDAFSEVKEQTQEGAHVPTELLHLFKDKWQSLRNLLNPKYISDSKVEALLRQWAGEDKQNKEKVTHERTVLKVLDEQMEEQDLQAVLMEVLHSMPPGKQHSQEEEIRSQVQATLCCMPSSRPNRATRKDVKQAAKFMLDRFGVKIEVPGAKPKHDDTWGGDGAKGEGMYKEQEDEPVEYLGDEPLEPEGGPQTEEMERSPWERCLPKWTRRFPNKGGASSISNMLKKVLKRGQPQPDPEKDMAHSPDAAAMPDPELAAVEQELRIQRQSLQNRPTPAAAPSGEIEEAPVEPVAPPEQAAATEKRRAEAEAARTEERMKLKVAMDRLAVVQAALTSSQEQLLQDQAQLAQLMREIPVLPQQQAPSIGTRSAATISEPTSPGNNSGGPSATAPSSEPWSSGNNSERTEHGTGPGNNSGGPRVTTPSSEPRSSPNSSERTGPGNTSRGPRVTRSSSDPRSSPNSSERTGPGNNSEGPRVTAPSSEPRSSPNSSERTGPGNNSGGPRVPASSSEPRISRNSSERTGPGNNSGSPRVTRSSSKPRSASTSSEPTGPGNTIGGSRLSAASTQPRITPTSSEARSTGNNSEPGNNSEARSAGDNKEAGLASNNGEASEAEQ